MTFEEAIRKSIKNYMKGRMPDAISKVKGGVKYDLKFFDKLEEMFMEDETDKKKKSKKKDKDEDLKMEDL
jgi:hypothetical protein